CNPCPPGGAGVAESVPSRLPPAAGIQEGGNGGVRPGAGGEGSGEPPPIQSPAIPESGKPERTPVPGTPIPPDPVARPANADRLTRGANAPLRFVGEKDEEVRAKADLTGRFAVELPTGEWTLYVPGKDGKPVFHSQLVVRASDNRLVTVVSR